MPPMNSSESTTRTAHGCMFRPLGALSPHSTIVCICVRSTASGEYARMLRRVSIVSITSLRLSHASAVQASPLPHFWQQPASSACCYYEGRFHDCRVFIGFPPSTI